MKIKNNIVKLVLCVLFCLAVGFTASFFTIDAIKNWYVTLNKPSFTPPNYLFGPVWTLLYILMGISLYYIIISTHANKRNALIVFGVQLFFNFWWSLLFFYWHKIGLALVDIILMWLFILLTIYSFGFINKKASYLLIPYFLWVSYATALNLAIYLMN